MTDAGGAEALAAGIVAAPPRSLRPTAKGWSAHVFTLLALAVWQGAAALSPPYLVPGPWAVAKDAARFFSDRFYLLYLVTTFGHVVASVALSFVVAGAGALLCLYLPVTRLLISGRIYPLLNSFTAIGWTVLAVVWFGLNDATVIFTITTVLVPFVFVNLREGLMALDRELGEMAESFTRNGWRHFRLIILPAVFPFMFAALRIAFGLAWKVALLAELFGDNRGFGFVVDQARTDIDTAMIFAVILLIIVIVSLIDRLVFAPVHAALSRHYAHG